MTEIYNLKYQKSIRRSLRKESISAERLLWKKIRNKQLGYKFKRQFGIGNYIVDFYCSKARLIIEIDGATHSTDKELKYDINKQKYIESLGLTVIRFNNSQIRNNLPLVLSEIVKYCEENNQPHPTLSF